MDVGKNLHMEDHHDWRDPDFRQGHLTLYHLCSWSIWKTGKDLHLCKCRGRTGQDEQHAEIFQGGP